jgi:ribosomal protein S18 acetylase RimI-like enzyme
MAASDLDNPFWSSLDSLHRSLALRVDEVARYPAQYAPFLGVADAEVDASEAMDALLAPNESVLLLGVMPRLSKAWQREEFAPLAQMVAEQPLQLIDGPEIIALDHTHADDVLALIALVYPHYFRPRTMQLGRYFGIYLQGRLAAMIGERLGTLQTREMSAICTHPDFNGRGLARRLTAWLTNDTLARSQLPFLHVSQANTRAVKMYQRLGYRLRREITFAAVRRA